MSEYDIPFWIQVGVGAISVFFALLAIFQSKRYNKSAKEYSQKIDSALNDMDSTIKDAVIDHMAKANECTREAIQAFNKQSTVVASSSNNNITQAIIMNDDQKRLLSAIDIFDNPIFWDGSVLGGDKNGVPSEIGLFGAYFDGYRNDLHNLSLIQYDNVVEPYERKLGNKKCVLTLQGKNILRTIRDRDNSGDILIKDISKFSKLHTDIQKGFFLLKIIDDKPVYIIDQIKYYQYIVDEADSRVRPIITMNDFKNREKFRYLNNEYSKIDLYYKDLQSKILVEFRNENIPDVGLLKKIIITLRGKQIIWIHDNQDRAKKIIALQS